MRRGVETIAAGRKDRPYGVFTSYVAFDRTDEDQLKRDRDEGVVRVVISLESAKADAILPELDRWAKLVKKVA